MASGPLSYLDFRETGPKVLIVSAARRARFSARGRIWDESTEVSQGPGSYYGKRQTITVA